jgi:PAS domain S-box-containing protein
MKDYEEELIAIRKLLRDSPKGLSISDISSRLGVSRNAIAKYMDILAITGQVQKQTYGPAKIYFLSNRIPLSAMVDITSDLILVFDKDLRLVQVNEGLLTLLGKPREEVLGLELTAVHLPLSGDHELEEHVRSALEGTSSSGEFYQGDEERYFNAKILPSTLEDCSPGVTVILADVTETKLMEISLRTAQQNFSNFFNSIDDFFFVTDTDCKIVHVNDTVIKRLGYWRSELVGQSICLVHPPVRQEEARRAMHDLLEGRTAVSTVPLITREGVVIPVETKVIHGVWDGRPVHFGVTKDLSQLRLSEEMFSRVFEMNPAATAISTFDGKILKVNEAFIEFTGYSRAETEKASVADLHLYEDPAQRDVIISGLSESGQIKNLEVVLRRKDGSRRNALLSVVKMEYAHISCLLSVMIDITERKAMERAGLRQQ